MLRHLSIREFALIEHVECTFNAGMTVLLGETGAGKSIIVDALAAALGERLSADQLRTGAKKAIIEATFTTSDEDVLSLIEEHNLAWENDVLVFRRELSAAGTSRCFVNDTPSQTSIVRLIAERLMDFHGQHDTHGLLNATRHIDVLDSFGGLGAAATDMTVAWANVLRSRQALRELRARVITAAEDGERVKRLLKEIDLVAPRIGEDADVTSELLRAESSEAMLQHAEAARDALYAGADSAYDRLILAQQHLEALVKFAPTVARYSEELRVALATCHEAFLEVATLATPQDFSAERLEELRMRLVALQRLIRKYGSIDEALAEAQRLRVLLDEVENVDDMLTDATQAERDATDNASLIAEELFVLRRDAAATLSAAVSRTLRSMGMAGAEFAVNIDRDELGLRGCNHVEFLFSSVSGEAPRQLSKVASGGELSRVMLAIKRALAEQGNVATMVFDEIDAGISGKAARHVGEVMKDLAARHQLLCITHLPQIASLADHYIRVEKVERTGGATVGASSIVGNDIVTEVARLLSGVTVTEHAMDSARELMSTPHQSQ